MRNALGRAERLDISGEWGSKGSNEYSVAVSQPRIGGQPITVEARVAQQFRNFLRHSSFTEQLRQAAVTVSTCATSYDASWRITRWVDGCQVFTIWLSSHTGSGGHGDKLCSLLYGFNLWSTEYVIAKHMPRSLTSAIPSSESSQQSGSNTIFAGTTALTL